MGLEYPRRTEAPLFQAREAGPLPASWDWRSEGAVSGVRNQGACGSCWAFSVAQNIEGQYFLRTGELLSMSAQQLVDCDKSNYGCRGGWPYNAIRWLSENGGLQSERDYPQNDYYHVTCTFDLPRAVAHPSGYLNISRDEEDLKRALY